MYAVVELQGHQYIVTKGMEIVVDKLADENAKTLNVDKVLLVFDASGKEVKVGAPYIDKAKVGFDVVEFKKGKKIRVIKFKNKTRYQRTYGHRSHQTVLKVKDIKING